MSIILNYFLIEVCDFVFPTHNPKVTGSSPVPATKLNSRIINGLKSSNRFFMLNFKTLKQQEYKSAYDLSLKKQFSDPKIYTANGDLSKCLVLKYGYRLKLILR